MLCPGGRSSKLGKGEPIFRLFFIYFIFGGENETPPAELRCEDVNGSFLSVARLIPVTSVRNARSARADARSYLKKFPWQGGRRGSPTGFPLSLQILLTLPGR